MQSLTAVVLGATGFIGELLVQQLLAERAFSKVRILVRRRLELSHPKLEQEVVDFNNVNDFQNKLGKGDCIFCCVGTTNKKVKGDKAAYRKVDFDIAVNAAKFGKGAGFKKYLLVSSVGANAHSANFYLKLKGEVEQAIKMQEFKAIHIFQPGLLLGERKEERFGEGFAKAIMKLVSISFVGKLNKYKGIEGRVVAKAMVAAAKSDEAGTFVYRYQEMINVLKGQ